MICNSCGARYNKRLIQCPYCGYEEIAVAEEEHQKGIRRISMRKKSLPQLQKKAANNKAKDYSEMLQFLEEEVTEYYSATYKKYYSVGRLDERFREIDRSRETNYSGMRMTLRVRNLNDPEFDKYREAVDAYEDYINYEQWKNASDIGYAGTYLYDIRKTSESRTEVFLYLSKKDG